LAHFIALLAAVPLLFLVFAARRSGGGGVAIAASGPEAGVGEATGRQRR
jgi:hypothetical protein